MKRWIHSCLLAACLLLLGTAKGQSIFSFSGSGQAYTSQDTALQFSFYNPLAAGSVVLPGDTGVHYINSGPMQYLIDTTNNCDTRTAASLDIDSIPLQMIFYNTPRTFFVKSAKLGSAIDSQFCYADTTVVKGRKPLGTLLFNRCQFFSYTTSTDTLDFYLRFVLVAANGARDTSKAIQFKIVPTLPFEAATFGIGGQTSLPDVNDPAYIVRTLSLHNKNMNYLTNDSAYTFSYSGVSVVLDATNQDFAPLSYNLAGKKLGKTPFFSLDTLNIYAETVTIADSFWFPGTTINIYAKNLVFQDVNGSHAYLCTTPLTNFALHYAGTPGDTGLVGGNINLHILNFTSDPGKRLIASGGDGQPVDTVRYMGLPGNGGNVISIVDVSNFVLTVGGYSGGKTYNPNVTYRGYAGMYNYNPDSAATWLHPNFFKVLVNYYKDAYYYGITTAISQNLQFYSTAFDTYSANGSINEIAPSDLSLLQKSVNEVRQVFYNLANNLDYFGNPPGWVPMLSFEVSADVYQNEVNHDMNILYLQQLINSTNTSLENRVTALNSLATEAANLVTSNLATYNNIANVVIPDEKQQIANNQTRIDSIENALITLQNQVQAEAQQEYNSQHSAIGEIVGGIATVCNMIPTPLTEAIGTGLDLTSQIVGGDFGTSFDNGQALVNNIASAVGPISTIINTASGDIGSVASDVSSGVSSISSNVSTVLSDFNNGDLSDALSVGSGISSQVSNLYSGTSSAISGITSSLDSAENIYNNVMHVSNDQLGSITGQLLASNPLVSQYKEEIAQIQASQETLAQELQSSTQQMQVAQNNVYANLDAESGFSAATYDANAAIDHYLAVFANDLARKATERLRLYQYYMVKAYEYRTLTPLNTNLDLTSISNQITQLLVDSNYKAVDPSVYTSALASVYTDVLNNIMDSIYNYYEDNKPAQTITSTYRLSNAEVATLNSGGAITLNMVQDGVFPPSEEDIRIVGLGVSKIVFNPVPYNHLGNVDEVDFNFAYPNYSRLKKNGIIYNFNISDLWRIWQCK